MNLGLTREELRGEVGRFLGYGRDYGSYNDYQKDDVDSWIRRGLRQFYSPPPIPGATKSHEWNFLRPTSTLATVVSTASYTLPIEVGGLVGDLVFASEQAKPSVEVLNYQRFLEAKITNPTRTGRPIYATATPTQTTDVSPAAPMSWTLELWPVPDKVYSLTYRYSAIQQDAFDIDTIDVLGTTVTLRSTSTTWPSWAGDATLSSKADGHYFAALRWRPRSDQSEVPASAERVAGRCPARRGYCGIVPLYRRGVWRNAIHSVSRIVRAKADGLNRHRRSRVHLRKSRPEP